jgi:hypothetical protein
MTDPTQEQIGRAYARAAACDIEHFEHAENDIGKRIHRAIEITSTNRWQADDANLMRFGVSWAAKGTKTPEETQVFIAQLTDAARIAQLWSGKFTVQQWNDRDEEPAQEVTQ